MATLANRRESENWTNRQTDKRIAALHYAPDIANCGYNRVRYLTAVSRFVRSISTVVKTIAQVEGGAKTAVCVGTFEQVVSITR